ENGQFRLVNESLRERNRLMATAPHYVKPLATTIPIFGWTDGLGHVLKAFIGWKSQPGRRGALVVKAGLTLYDLMAGPVRLLPRHEFRSREKALALRPALDPNIVCTATFYDARVTHAERLCLELVQDGESRYAGAEAWNYVRVDEADIAHVWLRDEVSGERFSVKPRIVVNATGAWIDLTNKALGRESEFIGGTKGSHVVIENKKLLEATRGEMLYFANEEGRVCIFYPFFGRIIAGSTDIPVENPDTAVCEETEVAYILKSISQVFPEIRVSRADVVHRFCGVRPLPRSTETTPGGISRDYSFPVIEGEGGVGYPVYSLVGGKWTTFRALAERVANDLLAKLGRKRLQRTNKEPIGGGKGYPPTGQSDQLVERYGWRAVSVQGYLDAGLDSPLEEHAIYTRREMEFLTKSEKVVHLDDLVFFFSLIGMLGQADRPLLKELAGVLATVLGWTEEQTAQEVERSMRLVTH
ncbi:MAG: glycerol-3-phosphate dehydrogenase/oxidase, partial [bacterium]|nr:glycerol-3-phosphate dehydrogenase/oxidase [bacterium]